MKRIITYGTFDLYHVGHHNVLKGAKALGDVLFVGISTDEFNTIKGKKADQNYWERQRIVGLNTDVDYIIPETNWEQKDKDIKDLGIDILVMGDDWKDSDKFKDLPCEVVFLPRTKGISSTKLRKENENKNKRTRKNKNDKASKRTSSVRRNTTKRSKNNKPVR